MKICKNCKQALNLEMFPSNGKGGVRSECRICWNNKMRPKSRAHYRANRQYYRNRNAVARKEISKFIRSKKEQPCTDCGQEFPHFVMDFDHVGDKEFNISSAVRFGKSIDTVTIEIEKCELVCANCHRIRTHARLAQVEERPE